MIPRIIDWSVRHPVPVFLLTAAAVLAGWWSTRAIPLDAIPDLGETQVTVVTSWDRGPDVIEDQLTGPLVTGMLAMPHIRDVRGISDFGASYVYAIFEDGTDLAQARARTVEALAQAQSKLPAEAKPEIGPDASGLGWVFQYALVDTTGRHNLADLRSLQDWQLRPRLASVAGVAEVASLGGFVRQYQIRIDPERLAQVRIPISKVISAVRASNRDVGGRSMELGGREYMVRGRGRIQSATDLEKIVLGVSHAGVPVTVGDVGSATLGPAARRGVADLDGKGEAVSGIVVMRSGEDALAVIRRVKAKLHEAESSLPPGVEIVTSYDRSELILRTIANLKWTLAEELFIVALVILLFLWHFPSAVIPILTIPVTIIVAFVPMRLAGVPANAMSLGGLAIAVGAMVDAAIVMVEQTHKKLEVWQGGDRAGEVRNVIVRAIQEVGGPSFFSLLVIAVSFLPVLALEAQEGRLFRPLALTKSFAMMTAALFAITLDPALRLRFTRTEALRFRPAWLCRLANGFATGTIHAEDRHPVTRRLMFLYAPIVRWSLRHRAWMLAGALTLFALTIPVYLHLGSEFIPPLDEGSLLFMPVTMPGISIPEARKLLQTQDRILASFPEVERVTGKAGRAETTTDPAPPSMIETVILLKPKEQWPRIATWYSNLPEWIKPLLRHIAPDHEPLASLIARMDAALHLPGVSNAWTMPIRGRIEMQTTGIRTPVGVKVSGGDAAGIEAIGRQVETSLRRVPGTRNAFAERTGRGYFVDIELNRAALARFGVTVEDANEIVTHAIGGEDVTTVTTGRARYPVNVRYFEDDRASIEDLGRIPVAISGTDRQAPLAEIADIRLAEGASMLRDENGLLTGYVYADVADRDIGGYVREAQARVRAEVPLPPGYALTWSGQFEAMERVRQRLHLVLPVTALFIVGLLYWNTRSLTKTTIVLLAVPFSAIGAIWLLAALGYNLSVAVWIGLIALMGVDAETGVFMLLYLDLAYEEHKRNGSMRRAGDLTEAIVEGSARRIRPKVMTVTAMVAGLAPILWSAGEGTEIMKRIAAPMVGGILTSFLLELAIYPVLYHLWRSVPRSRNE